MRRLSSQRKILSPELQQLLEMLHICQESLRTYTTPYDEGAKLVLILMVDPFLLVNYLFVFYVHYSPSSFKQRVPHSSIG